MDKSEVIARVRAERARWDELVAEVGDGRMLQPTAAGGWSGKDVLAHVVWYEREAVGIVKSRALLGSDLWALPVHQRNAGVHAEIAGLSLEQVRAWAERTFAALVEQLELLPAEAYSDPAYFAHMPGDWTPWQVIAGNTFRHYSEHAPALRALLSSDYEATQ